MRSSTLRRLPWRLAAILVAVQAVVISLIAWRVGAQIEGAAMESAVDRLRLLTPVLKERYAAAIESPGSPAAGLVISDGASLGLGVSLHNSLGDRITGSEHGSMTPESARGVAVDALRDGVAVRTSREGHPGTAVVGERLRSGGSAVGAVVVSAPVADGGAARAVGFVLSCGLGLLVATLGVLAWVSIRLQMEIARMAHGARMFSRGRFDRRIGRPAVATLRPLAASLDEMARQLEGRMAELDARQSDLNAILFSMSSGVVALDHEERIININRAARHLFGVRGEVRGRLLHEVLRYAELHHLATDTLAGRVPRPVELLVAGSSPRAVRAGTESLLGPDGRVRGVLLLLDDVSRIRRLETMRSDFAANVSHELRTPITNIKGFVETLLEVDSVDPARVRHFLEVIRRNSDRLSAIIEDVLSLTQLESADGGEDIPLEPTAVGQLVESQVGLFSSRAKAKHIRIETEVEDGLMARVHPMLLEQAIGNLLANAINYSPPATTVVIAAGRARSGGIEIAVRDEGPGIAPDHLERIFERFYRVDKGRSREVGGTGLGLAIVKHIVRAHGGTVRVESEVGSGSTFCIHLPASGMDGRPGEGE